MIEKLPPQRDPMLWSSRDSQDNQAKINELVDIVNALIDTIDIMMQDDEPEEESND